MGKMTFREANHVLWRGVRPAHEGEQVIEYNTVGNGTVVIYTVPANQVLYLVEAICYVHGNQNDRATLFYRTPVPVTIRDLCRHGTRVGWWGPADHFNPAIPLEIPATYEICLSGTNGDTTVYGGIFGWVE